MQAAQSALAARFGSDVRLTTPMLLKSWERNDVWRCGVGGGPPTLPASVIVKRFRDLNRGHDEWASLEFLTRLGLAPTLAPRFLLGVPEANLFVTEDLGPGRTLEDVLTSDRAEAAAESLLALARATARLHVATLDHHAEFDQLREALAPREHPPLNAATMFLATAETSLRAWLSATATAAPPGLAPTIDVVRRNLTAPAAFTTFTHGDLAPSNTHVSLDGVRLLDFEYGGVRPALYDTLFWTLFCPFPPPLIEQADATYRAELQTTCIAARDDTTYATARTTAVIWRTLNMLQWFPPTLLKADRPWAPGLTARQSLLWHLERLSAVAHSDELTPLIATLASLEHALASRWATERTTMFIWPAFSSKTT